jgi:hypothetical protein
MRRRRLALVTTGVVLAIAAPAQAWWGDGWIEKLSGPGRFQSNWRTFAPRLICIGPPPMETSSTEYQTEVVGTSMLGNFSVDKWARQVGNVRFGVTCHPLPPSKPRMEVGVSNDWFHSTNNGLPYSSEVMDARKRVDLRLMVFTADVRLNRVLDVGAGWGPGFLNRFKSHVDDEAPGPALFSTFHRAVVEPVRINFRPLALAGANRPFEWMVLRLNGNVFLGDMTAQDFGATGTFRSNHEWLWSWGIILDFTSMFR